jgi:UPF0042 nucleotide-binding protein
MSGKTKKQPLIIVTGLSGAGISTTMSILEDLGFSAYDNFPLSLLQQLLHQESISSRPVAVSFDARAHNFDPSALVREIKNLKQNGDWNIKTLFLAADDAVLLKRFSETRRTHPMARDRAIADGIAAEKSLLYALKHEAGHVVDTSDYTVHDLKRFLSGYSEGMVQGHLNLSVMSFSYRHGLPREADLVFDVRFLRNPNWDKDLKEKTGLSPDVQNYVRADESYAPFLENVKNMLNLLLPRYQSEGKSYLTIAFGCTGGKHRSVTVAEDVTRFISDSNLQTAVHHREIKSH